MGPDWEDVELAEDDFDEPDMMCGDCGDGVYAEDAHNVEAWERFGAIVCRACFNDRCEEDGDPDDGASSASTPNSGRE